MCACVCVRVFVGLDVLPVLAVKAGCDCTQAKLCLVPGHCDRTCQLPLASDAPACMWPECSAAPYQHNSGTKIYNKHDGGGGYLWKNKQTKKELYINCNIDLTEKVKTKSNKRLAIKVFSMIITSFIQFLLLEM